MSDFRKFLEVDQTPAQGDMGGDMGGADQIPGGIGGPPLPMGGDLGGTMGGQPPMGMGGEMPMAAGAGPTKTLDIKPIDVWDLLEKILGMKKNAQDELDSDNNLESDDIPR